MSQFAGTQQLVIVPKDLKECLKILPKEMAIEIFSYLEMGVILTLYDQFLPVILKCLKTERMRQKKTFASFFQELPKQDLIRLILSTASINKKMLMQAFYAHKRKLIETANKAKLKSEMQHELFKTIKVGDIIMNVHHNLYIITKKFAGSFKGRYVNISTAFEAEHGAPTVIIPPRGIEYKVFRHQLFIKQLERYSVISEGKLHMLFQVNQQPILRIENRIGGEVLGLIQRENVVEAISAYYIERDLNHH